VNNVFFRISEGAEGRHVKCNVAGYQWVCFFFAATTLGLGVR
jgi:hypothetical protein